jgi:hypothetical protein
MSSNADTDLISFFTLDGCLIDVSSHTTIGRHAFNFSCFSKSTFKDVWIYGSSGKTIGFYGIGTNEGSAPYYNVWENCYFGGIKSGISADDAATVVQTSNSNTVSNCRFQPGIGNYGVYIGSNNQNWRVINSVFESAGGTGIYVSGYGCTFTGNRFESMTTGISYTGNSAGCFDAGNYFDSNGINRSLVGNAVYQNTFITSVTATTGVTNSIHGNTIHYSVGSQNTVSAFGKDLGTNNSTYTSDSNLAPSTNWRHFSGFAASGGGVYYIVYGNGNVVNANNSYGAISDVTYKENIVDTTPKLESLLKVKVRNYTLKADEEKTKQIGVIAQELEQVFPGLVETDNEGLKSVKYSVFVPILIKAVQELSGEIESINKKTMFIKNI